MLWRPTNIFNSYIQYHGRMLNLVTAWKVSKYGFSGLYFRVFALNTVKSSLSSPEMGKYGPEKTPYLDTFHRGFNHSENKKWKSRGKGEVF